MTKDLITFIDHLPYETDQELRRRVRQEGLEEAFQLVAQRVEANKSSDSAVAEAVARITSFLEAQSDLPFIDGYKQLWKQVVKDEVRLSRTTLMQIRKSSEFKRAVLNGQAEQSYKDWVQSLDYTSAYLIQKMTAEGRSTAFILFGQGCLTRSKLKALSSRYDYAASMGYRRSAANKCINSPQTLVSLPRSTERYERSDDSINLSLAAEAERLEANSDNHPYELVVTLQRIVDDLLDIQPLWDGDHRVLEAIDPRRLSELTTQLCAGRDLGWDF